MHEWRAFCFQSLDEPTTEIHRGGTCLFGVKVENYGHPQMGTGHAQLVLETALAGADDDGGLMRQCNATGPACLKTLSLSTKRLFVRLVGMVERNNFVLQALPWFQAAMHMDLLPRVSHMECTARRAVFSGYGQGWRILSTRIRRTSTVCPPDQHAAAAALI